MGLRDSLNGKLGPGIGALLILGAVGFLAMQYVGGGTTSTASAPSTVFYTDDNGATFFKDSVKVVPFDHNGRKAYRADVFTGPDGKQFVGLVYRFSDAGKREMENYLSTKPHDADGLGRLGIEHRGMQVKRPSGDDRAWTLADEMAVERLQESMKTPSGAPTQLVKP